MAYPKGRPRPANSGRAKGTPNKFTADARERYERLRAVISGCDYVELWLRTIADKVPCGTCHGKKKTAYVTENGKSFMRKCASCHGTGWEKISLRDRLYATDMISKRDWPERKAIDVSGELKIEPDLSKYTDDDIRSLIELFSKGDNSEDPSG